MEFPTDAHGIVYRKQALELGFNDNRLRRAVADGELHRIWPGAYLPVPPSTMTPREVHKRRAIAASTTAGGDVIISHQSAAVLHGLDMLLPDLRWVHQTSGRSGGGRRDGTARRVHGATLEPGEITEFHGVTVTSLARTAVDVARSSPSFAHALSVLDAALRRGVTPEELEEVLSVRRIGIGQARLAMRHADGNSENPGESWGRAQLIVAGLPVPRLQREVYSRSRSPHPPEMHQRQVAGRRAGMVSPGPAQGRAAGCGGPRWRRRPRRAGT